MPSHLKKIQPLDAFWIKCLKKFCPDGTPVLELINMPFLIPFCLKTHGTLFNTQPSSYEVNLKLDRISLFERIQIS